METNKVLLAGKHKWPESIDFDRSGNFYFSDHAEKALFRVKRNIDGTLASMDEKLLDGFEHVGGISVDKDNNLLYLGVRTNNRGKIIQIPLSLFQVPTNVDYPSFKNENASTLRELDIEITGEKPRSPKPNGVIFDNRIDSVFYTDTDMPLGSKGFIGSTTNKIAQKVSAPNGVDIDPTNPNTMLVISLFWKKAIIRLDLNNNTETLSSKFGCGLDGLLCLENGDVLVASFFSKEIFHLSWNGYTYENPCVIDKVFGCPTDLTIGTSSDGSGESLFVTAMSLWSTLPLIKDGKIIEVLNIRELIKSKRNTK